MIMGPMTLEAPAMLMAWGEQDRQDREKEAAQRERERENRIYDQGREYIDQGSTTARSSASPTSSP